MHKIKTRKKKGPVEPGKEEEEDKLERFFCRIYVFHHIPVPNAPPVSVPAELPPRYAINLVPAVNAPVSVSVSASASPVIFPVPVPFPVLAPASASPVVPTSSLATSPEHSVISSTNFAVPSFVRYASPTPCIGTN